MKTISMRNAMNRQIAVIARGLMIMTLITLVATGCGRDSKQTKKNGGRGTTVASTPSSVTPAPGVQATPVEPEVTASPKIATYSEAEGAYFAGRYEEAAELFAGFVSTHPQSADGQYMLGLSRWKAGMGGQAEESFREALKLRPNHVKSLTNLARVLLDGGRAKEAMEPAGKAVDIDPANGDAVRVLGRAYHNLGMTDEAIACYERAVLLNDKDAWALNNLGLLLIEKGRHRDAIAPLARATRIQGDVASFHNNLGMALEHVGQVSLAQEEYGKAVASDSSYGKASANLARVEGRKQSPGLEVIDLAVLGDGFKVEPAPPASAEDIEALTPDSN
jgi:tetratricopeptide (TPR) repeat protein